MSFTPKVIANMFVRYLLPSITVIGLCLPLQTVGLANNLPSKSRVAQKLAYIVYMPDFSPSKPIPQIELMRMVWFHGEYGDFPKTDVITKPFNAFPSGFDNYVSRSTARRFVADLVGQDLRIWKSLPDGGPPILTDDKIGWWYNTSNTMYETPTVRIIKEKTVNGHSVNLTFNVFHRLGNLSNSPPSLKIGTGQAILQRGKSDWIVTVWHIDRNKNWH